MANPVKPYVVDYTDPKYYDDVDDFDAGELDEGVLEYMFYKAVKMSDVEDPKDKKKYAVFLKEKGEEGAALLNI